MFNKIKEKKGGFTLVELIIVLVILAVLAAFLVPTLTGYIKEADKKAVVSEARLAVMAAQTKADELYAVDRDADLATLMNAAAKITEVQTLAEVKGGISGINFQDNTNTAKVTDLIYESEDGKYTCTYNALAADGAEKYAVTE